jgi:hypothetical protein
MKIAEVALIFGALRSVEKFMPEFRQKMSWATLWANFSKTHLVTLYQNEFSETFPHGNNWIHTYLL